MNHAQQAKIASGLSIIVGLWLLIAPSVIGFSGTALATSSYVVGAIIALLAMIRMVSPLQGEWMSWTNGALGLWMILAPFLYGYDTSGMLWSSIIVGLIVAGLAVWSAGETHIANRHKHSVHH